MTRYLAIDPAQPPFDFGVDDAGRAQLVFNVNGTCEYTEAWLEELGSILLDAGAATPGVDLFYTSGHAVPTGDGPYLSIVETPGAPSLHIQNERSPPGLIRPAAQVLARARRYGLARQMALDAYLALGAVLNQEVLVTLDGPAHYRLSGLIVNAAASELFRDGAGGSLRVPIAENQTAGFAIRITGHRTDANESAHYLLVGTVRNAGGTTALKGPITKTVEWEDAVGWDATAEADDANDALAVKVTGTGSINWQADVWLYRSKT